MTPSGDSFVAVARIMQIVIAPWNVYWLHVRSLLRPRTDAKEHTTNGATASTKMYSHPGRDIHWRISCAYAVHMLFHTSPELATPAVFASGNSTKPFATLFIVTM